ncbi:hypothetical protein FOZ61_002615 [Perkinsus olseni]|uniref:Uncharacterized protein n=1 Tax=Perkinsus olseni TaxID=32597 RepID=A0A7J6LSG8_PEROL
MVARIALQAPRNSSNAALCVAAGILSADLELGTIAATRLAALGCAKALDQSLSVEGLTLREDRDGGDMEAKSYALEALRAKNAIFTDGSVVKDVKTGAAMVVYRGGVEGHCNFWKLSPYATITDFSESSKQSAGLSRWRAIRIGRSSRTVLKILSSRTSTARWDKASQTHLSLSEIPDRVSLRRVAEHSSISVNERPDELAAKGASMR